MNHESASSAPKAVWSVLLRDVDQCRRTTRIIAWLYLFAALGVTAIELSAWDHLAHPIIYMVNGLVVATSGAALLLAVAWLGDTTFRRIYPALTLVEAFGGVIVITIGLWGIGYGWGAFVTSYYPLTIVVAFYVLTRAGAILLTAFIAVSDALVLAVDHAVAPLGQWLFLIPVIFGSGLLIGGLASDLDEAKAVERAARTSLASMNARLRRFLAPEVADAVLASSDNDLLAPHRRRIAVMFCDLRGFTAFTNNAEPEEVVDTLSQYYETVGNVLRAHGATIGGYAGDGILAFFGDPVPTQHPALDAVLSVDDLRPALDALAAEWEGNAFNLHYGIGIAYGYATMGVVGFQGRYDYGATGAVVNLAARLCSVAAPGQVLLDYPTHHQTEATRGSTQIETPVMKGFSADTRVYALDA